MMDLDATRQILTVASALDPRLAITDEGSNDARVVAWADVLDGVHPQYAMEFVRKFYRSPQMWVLQAGEIRQGWLDERTRWERDRREAGVSDEPGQVIPLRQPDQEEVRLVPMSDEIRQRLLDAIPEGAPNAEALTEMVMAMANVAQYTDEQLAREQRCSVPACPCDHRDCIGGFLKQERPIVRHGMTIDRVARCPQCADALELIAVRR